MIPETVFDDYLVPPDLNLFGEVVEKNCTISQENCQRAKILSSPCQIAERKRLVFEKKMEQYQKMIILYDMETKEFDLNASCESKLVQIYLEHLHCVTTTPSESESSTGDSEGSRAFRDISNNITVEMICSKKKCIYAVEARAFLRVRSMNPYMSRGSLTYRDILGG